MTGYLPNDRIEGLLEKQAQARAMREVFDREKGDWSKMDHAELVALLKADLQGFEDRTGWEYDTVSRVIADLEAGRVPHLDFVDAELLNMICAGK